MSKTGKRTKRANKRTAKRESLRLLFTCVGRRVELLKAFRDAARALKIDLEIHGADINRTAPAIHFVDVPHIVPRIQNRRHIPELLKLVEGEKIDAIIPLIDSDLAALSRAAKRFERLGARVIISDVEVIKTCRDKVRTFEMLSAAGIDTPATWAVADLLKKKRLKFPYFFKPRSGSAGQGLFRVNTAAELRVFAEREPDAVVQEFIEGDELTLDVYTGLDGVPRCVVPRRRLEVRTGEVSKGIIVKNPKVIAVGKQVAEALGTCRGVVTVQCMVERGGRICVIEINPRFGGGAPLSIAAGADFPKWLMAELLGRKLRVDYEGYRDNLAMLRYDDSVFIDGDAASNGRDEPRPSTRHMT